MTTKDVYMKDIPQDEEFMEIPRDSYQLIERLNESFPHRCLLPGETQESAFRYAGMRQLIDELLELKRVELEAHDERLND